MLTRLCFLFFLLLTAATLLGACPDALAAFDMEFLAVNAAPEPAVPGPSSSSMALAVRFAAPGSAGGELLEVHVRSRQARLDAPVPGLSPLQWRAGFWESTQSSWSQANTSLELEARFIAPSRPARCELWYSVAPADAEGTARETIVLGESSDHAGRTWSMSGTGAAGGALLEWSLTDQALAVLEAHLGSVHVSGPLSETQLFCQPGLRVETYRDGWASAGQSNASVLGRLDLGGPALSVGMGLGWMQRDSSGVHRTDPGSAWWTYEGAPRQAAPDFRGETGYIEQRWVGAVLPLHLEWRPGPGLSVRGAVSAWWGRLTRTVRNTLHLYDGSEQLVGEPVLLTESVGPACGWSWSLGASFSPGEGTWWRVDAGPYGRVSVSLEVRA